MGKRQWVWASNRIRCLPTEKERAVIVGTCDKFVAEVLKPRFLPFIRPTRLNYPIDIYGKWHGGKYRFIQRYRSGFPDNRGWEFEAPFARFDYLERNRFDVMWRRHTGQWWRLYHSVSLAKAIRCIEDDCHLHPL